MIKGVVEGFYGPTWDLLDRLSIIDLLSYLEMNTYVYAPKWDPYHRERWRSPYPENILLELEILSDHARRRRVEPVYALSPGLDIDYSSREDLGALLRKYQQVMNAGYDSIALLLDDIPPVLRGRGYKTLAEAQASLANKVYKELKPKIMMLCPTHYWGYHEDYLRELGEKLDPEVKIFWTGPGIVSRKITVEGVKKFIEITGRKPLIWDNYPVNDYFLVKGYYRLHLGPYKGRDPKILDMAEGILLNPMNQAELSKIPIHTAGIFLQDPQHYNPLQALEEAITHNINPEARRAFRIIVMLQQSTPMDPQADHKPRPEEADTLLKAVMELQTKLTNKKMLHELAYLLQGVQQLVQSLEGKAEPHPRILLAGKYLVQLIPGYK